MPSWLGLAPINLRPIITLIIGRVMFPAGTADILGNAMRVRIVHDKTGRIMAAAEFDAEELTVLIWLGSARG